MKREQGVTDPSLANLTDEALIDELRSVQRALPREAVDLAVYLARDMALSALYVEARKNDMFRRYRRNGLEFDYALVGEKDLPPEFRRRSERAFSHCAYYGINAPMDGVEFSVPRASWLTFIVHDRAPLLSDQYFDYVAAQEHGEQVTAGDRKFALRLAFTLAQKRHCLASYLAWVEEYEPSWLADAFCYQVRLELSEGKGLQPDPSNVVALDREQRAWKQVEKFPWSRLLLEKLIRYKRVNDGVAGILHDALVHAGHLAQDDETPLQELIETMRRETSDRLRPLADPQLQRSFCFPRLDQLWEESRTGLRDDFARMLAARRVADPEADKRIADAGVADGLPSDGVFSPIFIAALQAAAAD